MHAISCHLEEIVKWASITFLKKIICFKMSDSTIVLVKHMTVVSEFNFDAHPAFSFVAQSTTPCNEFMNHFICRLSSRENFSQEVQELLFGFDKL